MFGYTIYEWLLFFYIYCFIGWIFESTVVSVNNHRFVNRGFLQGPFIPIYGEGALMVLLATIPVKDNLVLVFFMGMLGATLLELVIGTLMESIFKVKYWDYSHHKIQFKGYICLTSSLCWGVLSVLMVKVIHAPIEGFVQGLPRTAAIIAAVVLTIYFIYDTVTSVIEAWGMTRILAMVTRAKDEIQELQQQLEAYKEITMEQLGQKKLEFKLKLDEMQQPQEKEPVMDRLKAALAEHESLERILQSRKNRILKRNPSASSKKFGEALSSLKEYMEESRKNKR